MVDENKGEIGGGERGERRKTRWLGRHEEESGGGGRRRRNKRRKGRERGGWRLEVGVLL